MLVWNIILSELHIEQSNRKNYMKMLKHRSDDEKQVKNKQISLNLIWVALPLLAKQTLLAQD